MLLAKTCVNLSYFSLPRLSLFFEKLSQGTHRPYSHYHYSFLFDTDDEFLLTLVHYDYKAIVFDKKCFITLSLEQCIELLSRELKGEHHKNLDYIAQTLVKDGFEKLVPGLYFSKGSWHTKET